MKYLFLGHYINLLFKWKLKWLRVILALLMLAVPFLKYKGIINFVLGKLVNDIEMLAVGGAIYLLFNFLYVLLVNAPKSIETFKKETEPKPKEEKEREKAPIDIIKKVDYKSTQVKLSPRKEEEKPSPVKEKPENQHTFEKGKKEEFTAPPIDTKLEVNEPFFENEKKEYEGKYTGEINEDYVPDITDVEIEESELPNPETALYERVKMKKNF